MDPELLRLLLEIFGSQGEAGNGSPDSPYVPPLTDYTGDYYSAMTTPTPNDALGAQSTGGGQAEQQIGGLQPVPSLSTDRSFFTPIPWSTAMMPTTDWNAQSTATGHAGPMTYEDGTVFPGEPDPALVPQMIAGQFQQYPANGVPRPQPTYLNALQSALQQAHANGGRQPHDLFIGRSNEPYFDEYDQALASHRDPINPPLAGLFGGGKDDTKSKKVRPRAPQAAQHVVAQARAAQPQRQYSAPAPQRQVAFTPAPAPRAAAQATLANALNTLRSLSRR
jgi:hypothetical protein